MSTINCAQSPSGEFIRRLDERELAAVSGGHAGPIPIPNPIPGPVHRFPIPPAPTPLGLSPLDCITQG